MSPTPYEYSKIVGYYSIFGNPFCRSNAHVGFYFSALIYPRPINNFRSPSSQQDVGESPSRPFEFEEMKKALSDHVRQLEYDTDAYVACSQASSIATALLFLNRLEKDLCSSTEIDPELDVVSLLDSSDFPARIILISLSEDHKIQTNFAMDSIFASLKKRILIDSCLIGTDHESPILQASADITGGYHCQVSKLKDFQLLMTNTFLVDGPMRSVLVMPSATSLNHAASCICHNQTISVGYACSVCLLVYCSPPSQCAMCGATYSGKSVPHQASIIANQVANEST